MNYHTQSDYTPPLSQEMMMIMAIRITASLARRIETADASTTDFVTCGQRHIVLKSNRKIRFHLKVLRYCMKNFLVLS